jgi:transposase
MNTKIDTRSLDAPALEDLRRRVVAAVVEQGLSKSEAARVFGVSRTSVHLWLDLYRRRGEAALRPKRPGRKKQPSRLKGWQVATLVGLLTHHTPDELGLPFALWTREAVGELIARRFGVRVSVWTVGRWLRRWGFTPQKPARRAYERNPRAMRRWHEEEYPEIARRAEEEGAEIHWGDQLGVRNDHQAGRSYGRRGHTPVVRSSGKRFSCNVMSTITNEGDLAFLAFTGSFNSAVLLEFLPRLVRDAEHKVFLIWDGHPVHRAAAVQEWLADHREQIEVFPLPAYAPELNPDELLNQDVKANVFQQPRAHDQEELIEQVCGYLEDTQDRPDIVRSYFQEEHVSYAAAS